MRFVWLLGGPVPYQEAVSAKLADEGLSVSTDAAAAPQDFDAPQTIVVAYCSNDHEWRRLEALDGFLGRTAVIDRLEPALYERGLRMGLGVVHIDTKSETIAAAAISAGHGEALIPMEVARRLVGSSGDRPADELDPLETDLLRSIARGETLVSIGSRYHYSERTLRRRLQSAYLKLGVHDRPGAIRAADRLGLI